MDKAQRNFESLDYYTDPSLFADPYAYYEFLRAKGPVQRLPGRDNVVAVTGFEEALAVYQDAEHYSTINNLGGPLIPVPLPEGHGDDITPYIEAARPHVPMGNQLITFDNQQHARIRSLLMRLFTPSRLKANEIYLTTLSGQLIDKFADSGKVEILSEYGNVFAGLVIADLLGVPQEDRAWFTQRFEHQPPVGTSAEANPLAFLDDKFSEYIADRRRRPRADVMSELANSSLSDGSMPTEVEVMRVATFLFAAGQDTTARFLAMCMHAIAEHADVQQALRSDPTLIPNFIEEVLRFEGPVKTSHRMVRKSTTLAGVELPAGTNVALMQAAMNRDPRRFEDPATFKLGRPRAKEHLGFGRGAHTCPGAARRAPVASIWSRPSSCVATKRCTSNSRRSGRAREPRRCRHRWLSTPHDDTTVDADDLARDVEAFICHQQRAHRCNVVRPTEARDVLYVASTDDNAVFAIGRAAELSAPVTLGSLVFADSHLRGPLGLALAPNGHLLAANGDAVNADPAHPSEIVEFTRSGEFVREFNLDAGEAAAFGVAIDGSERARFNLALVNDATNAVAVYRLP